MAPMQTTFVLVLVGFMASGNLVHCVPSMEGHPLYAATPSSMHPSLQSSPPTASQSWQASRAAATDGTDDTDDDEVSYMGASVSVSPSGAAALHIPFRAPEGAGGHTPSLSLSFNSRHEVNGIAGRGFSIGGISHITRCASSIARDGFTKGVSYTLSDRFCLGGSRLVNTTGQYGADGTVYFVEKDTFSRVVSHVDPSLPVSSGPTSWEVTTKVGEVMTFGGSPTAWVYATGTGSPGVVSVWLLAGKRSALGNAVSYSYITDAAPGSYALSHVNFTSNAAAGIQPSSSFEFLYDDARPDRSPRWLSGSVLQQPLRLRSVSSYYHPPASTAGPQPRQLAVQYRPTFQQDCRSNSSLLSAITECDANGTCGRPLQLAWDGASPATCMPAFESVASPPLDVDGTSQQLAQIDFDRVHLVDINADGRTDFVRINGFGSAANISIWLTQVNASGYTALEGPSFFVSASVELAPIDLQRVKFVSLDGDRFPELYIQRGQAGENDLIYRGNGDGIFAPPVPGPLLPAQQNAAVDLGRLGFGDFNGDGINDVYRINGNSSGAFPDSIYLFAPDLTFTHVAGPATTPVSGLRTQAPIDVKRVHVVDMNGDKLSDLYVQTGSGPDPVPDVIWQNLGVQPDGTLAFAKMSGPATRVSSIPNVAALDLRRLRFVDVNVDGAKDVYEITLSPATPPVPTRDIVHLHLGNFSFNADMVLGPYTTVHSSEEAAYAALDVSRISTVDVNQDGMTDVMYVSSPVGGQPTRDLVYLSSGSQFSFSPLHGASTPVPNAAVNPIFGLPRLRHADINGDGSLDVVFINGSSSAQTASAVQLNSVRSKPSLSLVVDGHGARTALTYLPLTDPRVYTPVSPPAFPLVENRGPAHVVAVVRRDDGLGGFIATNHSYAGNLEHRQGLGSLGFAQTTSVDVTTSMAQIVTLSQDWKHRTQSSPVHSRHVLLSNGTLLRESFIELNTTFTCTASVVSSGVATAANGCIFVTYVNSNKHVSNDLDGGLVATTVGSFWYDEYQNKIHTVTNTTDAFGWHAVVLDRTFVYNSTAWLMGMATSKTVTAMSSYAEPVVKRTVFVPDTSTGLVITVSEEPGHPTLWLNTTTQVDGVGNTLSVEVEGANVPLRKTTFTYDDQLRFKASKTDALGHTTTYTYDAVFGSVLSSLDPNRVSLEFRYDSFGALTGSTVATGMNTTRRQVWCNPTASTCAVHPGTNPALPFPGAASLAVPLGTSSALTTTSRCGEVTVATHDVLGRQTRSYKVGFGARVVASDVKFNARGLEEAHSLPYFMDDPSHIQWVTNQYDVLRRPTVTVFPDGNSTSVSYSGFNHTSTNTLGESRTTVANAGGDVLMAIDSAGQVTRYTYTSAGLMSTASDTQGLEVLRNRWDQRGHKLWSWNPDSGNTTMTYDALGDLLTSTDALGMTSTTSYDLLGRVVSHSLPDEKVQNTYDSRPHGVGRVGTVIKSVAANGTTVRYEETSTYDQYGRQVQRNVSIDGDSFLFSMTYDSCGRLWYSTDPSGVSTAHAYSAWGSTARIYDYHTGTVYFEPSAVDASDRVLLASHSSGAFSSARQYSVERGWLESVGSFLPDGKFSHRVQYVRDASGAILERTTTVPVSAVTAAPLVETFTYDSLHRLKASTSSDPARVEPLAMTYSPSGNILSKSNAGTYTYGSPDFTTAGSPTSAGGPHAVISIDRSSSSPSSHFPSAPAADWQFTYNQRGDMLSGGGRHYSYYASGSTKSVSSTTDPSGPGSSSMVYGPTGAVLIRTDVSPDGEKTTQFFVSASFTRVTSSAGTHCRHTPHSSVILISDCGSLATSLSSSSSSSSSSFSSSFSSSSLLSSSLPSSGRDRFSVQASEKFWSQRLRGVPQTLPTLPLPPSSTLASSSVSLPGGAASPPATTAYYLALDGANTVGAVLSANGSVLSGSERWYDPFGLAAPLTSPAALEVTAGAGFDGHRELQASKLGLVHMGARMYDPVVARFTSADPTLQLPFHSQDLNPYSYVVNNPLNDLDPTGFGLFGHFFHHIAHAFSHMFHSIVNAIRHDWAQLLEAAVDIALTATGNAELIHLVNDAMSLVEAKLEGASWGSLLKMAAEDAVTSVAGGGMLITPLEDGVFAKLNGGSFVRGFAGGMVGDLGGLDKSWDNTLAFQALLGGLSSEVEGGSFISGAVSSSISFEAHRAEKAVTPTKKASPNHLHRRSSRSGAHSKSSKSAMGASAKGGSGHGAGASGSSSRSPMSSHKHLAGPGAHGHDGSSFHDLMEQTHKSLSLLRNLQKMSKISEIKMDSERMEEASDLMNDVSTESMEDTVAEMGGSLDTSLMDAKSVFSDSKDVISGIRTIATGATEDMVAEGIGLAIPGVDLAVAGYLAVSTIYDNRHAIENAAEDVAHGAEHLWDTYM